MTLLSTENLSITIAKKKICHGLQLTLQPGEIWGILGQNGSGKTTLLHTLAGLKVATEGNIFLLQKPLKQLTRKQIAQYIGILLQQQTDIFPQSVYELCLYARFPHHKKWRNKSEKDYHIVQDAIALMDLTVLQQQNVMHLSGGERQRLALAMLFAQQPQIYLLDEPTNHLDIRYQIKVLNHVKMLAKTQTVGIIMALHDLNLAQHYCDKILLLFNNGETLHGTTQQMLTTKNISRLYEHPVTALHIENTLFWTINKELQS